MSRKKRIWMIWNMTWIYCKIGNQTMSTVDWILNQLLSIVSADSIIIIINQIVVIRCHTLSNIEIWVETPTLFARTRARAHAMAQINKLDNEKYIMTRRQRIAQRKDFSFVIFCPQILTIAIKKPWAQIHWCPSHQMFISWLADNFFFHFPPSQCSLHSNDNTINSKIFTQQIFHFPFWTTTTTVTVTTIFSVKINVYHFICNSWVSLIAECHFSEWMKQKERKRIKSTHRAPHRLCALTGN